MCQLYQKQKSEPQYKKAIEKLNQRTDVKVGKGVK